MAAAIFPECRPILTQYNAFHILKTYILLIYSFIHEFIALSYYWSIASSKANSPIRVI